MSLSSTMKYIEENKHEYLHQKLSEEKSMLMEVQINRTPPPLLACHDESKVEILSIHQNGDFFYRGKLIENDKQITNAFREFLESKGFKCR